MNKKRLEKIILRGRELELEADRVIKNNKRLLKSMGKGDDKMKCVKCNQEARVPCHKLDGKVLCFECNKKEGKANMTNFKKVNILMGIMLSLWRFIIYFEYYPPNKWERE